MGELYGQYLKAVDSLLNCDAEDKLGRFFRIERFYPEIFYNTYTYVYIRNLRESEKVDKKLAGLDTIPDKNDPIQFYRSDHQGRMGQYDCCYGRSFKKPHWGAIEHINDAYGFFNTYCQKNAPSDLSSIEEEFHQLRETVSGRAWLEYTDEAHEDGNPIRRRSAQRGAMLHFRQGLANMNSVFLSTLEHHPSSQTSHSKP